MVTAQRLIMFAVCGDVQNAYAHTMITAQHFTIRALRVGAYVCGNSRAWFVCPRTLIRAVHTFKRALHTLKRALHVVTRDNGWISQQAMQALALWRAATRQMAPTPCSIGSSSSRLKMADRIGRWIWGRTTLVRTTYTPRQHPHTRGNSFRGSWGDI